MRCRVEKARIEDTCILACKKRVKKTTVLSHPLYTIRADVSTAYTPKDIIAGQFGPTPPVSNRHSTASL